MIDKSTEPLPTWRSEAPRGKPRGIFAEPCEAKNAIHPCGNLPAVLRTALQAGPQGILAKKGKTHGSSFLTLKRNVAKGLSAILADFDGDGFADPGVYNEAGGTWTILLSSAGYSQFQYDGVLGSAGFKPVPADYDSDGRADPAVYNPTTGDWKALLSNSNYYLLEISGLLGLP